MKNIDKVIKETLEIKITYIDLFYAFCNAKGIEDPECDIESDEEYDALEKEFEEKIKYGDLQLLRDGMLADCMERVNYKMREVERR